MAVVWDILHGAPDYSFYAIQGQILVDGGLAAGSTTTEFTLEAGDGSKMTLRGTFALNGDDVESGTINRIDFVDADGTLVAKAPGYTGGDAIDVVEFFAALADVANDPFVTLYSALVGGMPLDLQRVRRRRHDRRHGLARQCCCGQRPFRQWRRRQSLRL